MRCVVCGNADAATFEIFSPDGMRGPFDSFECAIHDCAPRCATCGVVIVGHGVAVADVLYCCASCARQDDDPGIDVGGATGDTQA